MMSSDEAWDSLKVMMTTIDDIPDTKGKYITPPEPIRRLYSLKKTLILLSKLIYLSLMFKCKSE